MPNTAKTRPKPLAAVGATACSHLPLMGAYPVGESAARGEVDRNARRLECPAAVDGHDDLHTADERTPRRVLP